MDESVLTALMARFTTAENSCFSAACTIPLLRKSFQVIIPKLPPKVTI
jgi:hypothetical protein